MQFVVDRFGRLSFRSTVEHEAEESSKAVASRASRIIISRLELW